MGTEARWARWEQKGRMRTLWNVLRHQGAGRSFRSRAAGRCKQAVICTGAYVRFLAQPSDSPRGTGSAGACARTGSSTLTATRRDVQG